MGKPGVLPAFEVWIADYRVTVRVTLEDQVEIELPEDEDGGPRWDLLQSMTPEEAINLAEALTLAARATQERQP